jgi:hypothetical protein
MVSLLSLSLLSSSASALTLSETARSTLAPGVELVTYRTASPTTDTRVVEVDLCADGVRVDATRTPGSTESVAAWASDLDPIVAVNGDFFRTGPVRVYGDAVGGGVPWPSIQTGLDSAYSSEWYYGDFGWVAFLHDEVLFTHTGWAKDNAASLGISGGYAPSTRNPSAPDRTMALVSGFPALVVEGTPMVCADPTASSCFPDRSDMRDRHPRTAMGLSADLQTLYLAVVDGRSSRSSGMYGSELADLMGQLGAWQAFNLDGGGSSTLWTAASGVVNVPSDGSARSVANHLGVFVDPPTGSSTRPWHCPARPVCDTIPPGGGTLDEAGDCFTPFGPPVYLREVSGDGEGGSLVWTNQFSGDQPWNQAWWHFELEEAGDYLVEWHGVDGYAVAEDVPHRLWADGVEHVLSVDQSVGEGWHALGTFAFAAGGDQMLVIEDHASGSVPSNQHIVFDAIRLTRVGTWCGDSACDADESCATCPEDCPPEDEVPANGIDDDCDGDVDETDDTGEPPEESGLPPEDRDDSAVVPDDTDEEEAPATPVDGTDGSKGSGCAAVGAGSLGGVVLAVMGVVRRRRRGRGLA